MKNLKVRGEFHWDFEDFFVTKLLSKKFELKRVEKNASLIIGLVEPTPFTAEFKKGKKKLLISGENLFYKINLSKLLEYLSKKIRLNFFWLTKNLPPFVLNIKFGIMRGEYLNYILNLSKKNYLGEYAIISNNIKGKNIFNLPFFLQIQEIRRNISKLKNKYSNLKKKKKFCCIVVSNESAIERVEFFKKLSKYKKVDCFGSVSLANSDNSKLPKCWSKNYEFFSQYKFVIAFENSFEEEYITEKLPNVMLANSIPIYRGAPNISEYFNTESFINYDNYGCDYDRMIEKIIQLDKDDSEYFKFLKNPWMNKKNIKKIENKEKDLIKFLYNIVQNDGND